MNFTRTHFADLILEKLIANKNKMHSEFKIPGRIKSCFIDDLLPEHVAAEIYSAFPTPEKMAINKSLRENKKIAAQMNLYKPILEEIVYAFQDSRVVKLVEEITEINNMMPDENLYAGGISLMSNGDFLNPHLDNSHDNERENYRVLNLLYYVTPNWGIQDGGNLELWDNGMSLPQRTIHSRFNRLVLMVTNKTSIHSVSKVVTNGKRCCVSNYYFSNLPTEISDYFHVTSFYGRPGEPVKNFFLRADAYLRQFARKFTGKRLVETKHIYKKK